MVLVITFQHKPQTTNPSVTAIQENGLHSVTSQQTLFIIVSIAMLYGWLWYFMPITVAPRSKAWTAFAHLNAGIVGSNPIQGIDVCVRLFCVCVVLCVGSGLATGWSPFQGVLPTVYRIKKLKKWPRSDKGLYSHRRIERWYFIMWPGVQKMFFNWSVANY
jgi:hypothetical protein